ncbi:MAG: hypothetical protein J5J06_18000 [Phycisphaerae bacterium]|nr:hypothetical protein [Phycisphaerae bacterium]
MNPILPIDSYSTGQILGSGISPQQPTSVNSGGGISPSSGSQVSGLNQISNAIGQMLQSVGGGLENDQMLRAVIGMIILMAVIEQLLGNQQDQGQQALAQLGGNNSGAGTSLFISSTSVSIDYSSTTIVYGAGQSADTGTGDAGQSGQSIDLAW